MKKGLTECQKLEILYLHRTDTKTTLISNTYLNTRTIKK